MSNKVKNAKKEKMQRKIPSVFAELRTNNINTKEK